MSDIEYLPNIERFIADAGQHGLIPVCREIVADLDTPLTIFAKVAAEAEHCFLFESMEGGEKWGRFSFIGFDPIVLFEARGDQIEIRQQNVTQQPQTSRGNPMFSLKKLIVELAAADYEHLPRFCGGAVGYLGYDMVRFFEELPDERPGSDFADGCFQVPGTVLVHDSFRQTVKVVRWVRILPGIEPVEQYQQARKEIDSVVALMQQPVGPHLLQAASRGTAEPHTFTGNMSRAEFEAMVERAKEYILAGDIIQVVLSQRFHTQTDLDSLVLYRALRHINPSPYLFYLRFGEMVQIGSSPEILVRKDGEDVELRPIAGTRRRGRNAQEDLDLEKELLTDPKETAEHLMLVDLGRNDVGRVARGGQVQVRDLLVVERYSHVMHIVSGVHGRIEDGKDQFDVLAACFPAGTVSGAPKIRAMQIIDELEPDRRGPYAGSVGYFGFSGNMDFCITIRTFIKKGRDLWIQAGAGIVSDSVPALEFEETVNKSMALRRALELAQRGF